MQFDRVIQTLEAAHIPSYRLQQLVDVLRQGGTSWNQVTTWPQPLRDQIAHALPFTSWVNSEVKLSADGTHKAVLTLRDGRVIETVLMQPKPNHWSVCLSSEVGCAMNCAFCATGKMGFIRPLTAAEITDQLLFWLAFIHQVTELKGINSVVFMGMGEPFHNSGEVFKAVSWLNTYYRIGSRHLSISTSGVPEGILALAKTCPQVNLAVSLHAAAESVRSALMPINQAYSLARLKPVLLQYLSLTKRQLMFEYLLIAGVNDRRVDREQLLSWLSDFPSGLVHINLIRFNDTHAGFAAPPVETVEHWKHWLEAHHLSVSIRKNLGADIQGACGQLAARANYPITS